MLNKPSRDEVIGQLTHIITSILEEDKAENIVTIELAGRANFADKMIIATCLSPRQMSAVAHHIERSLKEEGFGHAQVEGDQNSDWVLMDAGDIVVHLFLEESRELYALERMWGKDFDKIDAEIIIEKGDLSS